jgi:ribosomal protein L11 methylase PrmA
VDIDPQRIKESTENAEKNQVADKVEIRQADVLEVKDLGRATVLTLYLLPDHIKKLEPNLKSQLKPGTRIVAHDFAIEDWKADQEISYKGVREFPHTLFVYQVKGGKSNGGAAKEAEPKKLRSRDVIFVPTPQAVVDKMLELAKVTKEDVVFDLGCGDGRIPVTAAKKYGVKATGFDIDPQRIKESNANVQKNKVGDKVTIKHADIFEEDLSPASVVTLYLLPSLNVKLIPQLEKLKPGSRIVSHDFDMAGIKPDRVETLTAKDDEGNERQHTIYLWTVPLKKE